MAEPIVSNSSPAPGEPAPPTDPGTAKRSLAINNVTPADPPPSFATTCFVPYNLPLDATPQAWTDNICEICWNPVTGKRPKANRKESKRPKKATKDSKRDEPAGEYWLRLPCGHRFGSLCLTEWRNTENEASNNRSISLGQSRHQCPSCKKPYLYHTCHRKSRWRFVRGCLAAKNFVTFSRVPICVRCELEEVGGEPRGKIPAWERGFGAITVGLVLYFAIPHNQKHGHEAVTPVRQFLLRHLPHAWKKSMEKCWHTKIEVGSSTNPREVSVKYTQGRRPRKPTRKERRDARSRQKQDRNLVRKQRNLPGGSFSGSHAGLQPLHLVPDLPSTASSE